MSILGPIGLESISSLFRLTKSTEDKRGGWVDQMITYAITYFLVLLIRYDYRPEGWGPKGSKS